MDRKRVLQVAFLLGVVSLVVAVGWTFFSPGAHERATVTVVDEDGTELATVDARVADTFRERYTGLSETESLPNGSGMLFVHDSEGRRTYVMREMDFDIDIVFVDAEGRITEIHHARKPRPGEDGNDLRYSGRAKYVLEVPRGFTNATGIEEGDRVRIRFAGGETVPAVAGAAERRNAYYPVAPGVGHGEQRPGARRA